MNEINNMVISICYDTVDIFSSKKEAKDFYLRCMMNSEGSEKNRYAYIYQDLELGYNLCVDDSFIEDLELGRIKFLNDKKQIDIKEYLIKNLKSNSKLPPNMTRQEVEKLILNDSFRINNVEILNIIKQKNKMRVNKGIFDGVKKRDVMRYVKTIFKLLDKEFENEISYRYKLLILKNKEYNNYAVSLAIDISNNGDKNIIAFGIYEDFIKLNRKKQQDFIGDFYNAGIIGKKEDEFEIEDAKKDFLQLCDFNYLKEEKNEKEEDSEQI